ncbi:right-handed parallel beta-helix repeat-containing protein [Bacillus spongiae]|uniref:Right-handed parallel beta-helix repeat-containing protein n=1 Tax=Bacillus spongiae TaxID=2683610 RepID=A0ABU8H8I9_9BACI
MVLRIVPTDFLMVQDAIDVSIPGDSIQILAGKFDGFRVDVENLKIFGCGIGRTIIAGAPAQGTSDGVFVSAERTTLQGFTVQGFIGNGIFISSSSSVLKEVEVKFNTLMGILGVGNSNLIINCIASNNTSVNGSGIEIFAFTSSYVINCISTQNLGDGYFLRFGKLINSSANENNNGISVDTRSTILANETLKNNGSGITIASDLNNIIDNKVCNNEESGIELTVFSDENAIDSNIARNNGTDITDAGILVDPGSADNTIRFNKARNNVEFDIEAIPPADTDNTFDGNKCENSDPPGLCT